MNSTSGKDLRLRYLARKRGAFPGEDIKRLCVNRREQVDFHSDLDYYLSSIAGYLEGADRLQRRAKAELLRGEQFLSKPFFDRFGEHPRYEELITLKRTPEVYCTLADAEFG